MTEGGINTLNLSKMLNLINKILNLKYELEFVFFQCGTFCSKVMRDGLLVIAPKICGSKFTEAKIWLRKCELLS
jgi:hypothetical protein